MPELTDDQVMCALIRQVSSVSKAIGGPETNVTTVITAPMWRAWCRAVRVPEDSEPTEWLGIHDTIRVYGSRTIVRRGTTVMQSMSFPTEMEDFLCYDRD